MRFGLHELIIIRAINCFESNDYIVLWREDLLKEIKKYSYLDHMAIEGNEAVIFEAKVNCQLGIYSQEAKEVVENIPALSMVGRVWRFRA